MNSAHGPTAVLLLLIVLGVAGGCPTSDRPTASDAPAELDVSLMKTLPLPDLSRVDTETRLQLQQFADQLARSTRSQPGALEQAEAFGNYGRAALAAEFIPVAEACFLNASTLQPTEFEWPYLLGHLYRGDNQLEAAIASFQRATTLDPESIPAWAWLGRALYEHGEINDATRAFEELLRTQPDSAVAEYHLGKIALDRREYQAAIEHIERALERFPGATVAHYPLALAWRGLGDTEKAQAHMALRGETDLFPFDPWMDGVDDALASLESDLKRGVGLLSVGRVEEAGVAYRSAIRRAPADARPRLGLASVLFAGGDYETARATYQQALDLDPASAAALYGLGAIKERGGSDGESERYYREAVSQDPSLSVAWLRLGELLRRVGRPAEAVEAYRHVLTIDPLQPEANFGAMVAMTTLGRWQEAVALASEATRRVPDQPAFAHALARLYVTAPAESDRDANAALGLLRELQDSGFANSDVAETIAMAMAETGRFDEAIRWQAQVVEAVRSSGNPGLLSRADRRLQSYLHKQPCREPWPKGDPVHIVDRVAPPAPAPAPYRKAKSRSPGESP